jgi:hypothetical protein
MCRYNCTATIIVTKEMVAAFDSENRKASLPEGANQL